ncbi:hypothetical protein ABVT39_003320 [Epinephelus coioides]
MTGEELHYTTVTFKTKSMSKHEKPSDLEIIYEEVTAWEEQTSNTNPAIPENEKKAPPCTRLHLLAACLGIIFVILASIVVSIHFNKVMSEQHQEYVNLKAQNLQLRTENSDLEKRMKDLIRERDGLNWTVSVILEYESFPVNLHCPQRVCQPCLDGWVLFQSNCYLFSTSDYSSYWKNWQGSQDQCRQTNADLVVIESQGEQEFINNHTKYYHDDNHGYWIGLHKMDTWMWVDGTNFTVMYWKTQQAGKWASCALTLPQTDPLANWVKMSCNMYNRFICETRALIKPD